MWLWLSACTASAPPEPVEEAPRATRRATVHKPAQKQEKWAGARCNDGTPFAYELRPGDEPLWLVNFAGGFFCDDEVSACADRAKRLVTTLPGADGKPTRMKAAGIFSPDPASNPTFSGATHVDAHYCSSDLWVGDSLERRPNSGDAQGWHFSGRENVRVLLEALREVHGLDQVDPNTRIVVLGTSAGAAGVVGNLDQLVAAFPDAVRDRRLFVILDGGWVAPPPAGAPLPNAAKWGPPEPDCVAAGVEPRSCVLGPVWWPYVERRGVPVLVQISGLDKTQTPVFGIDTPEEQLAWQRAVRDSLAPVPWVYSGAEPYHVVAIEERWSKGDPSLQAVVDRFLAGAPPERVLFGYPD